MARLKEKIAYALGDAAAGGIVWKVMSIAFPLFFTNVFGLSFADAAVLMLVARMFDVCTDCGDKGVAACIAVKRDAHDVFLGESDRAAVKQAFQSCFEG